MPVVEFMPSGKRIDVPPGTELLDAARSAGLSIPSDCGGEGTCGACLVRITAGLAQSAGAGNLSDAALAEGYVLACKTRVADTPLTVEVPAAVSADQEGGKFSDIDETHLIHRRLLPKSFQYDPLGLKWLLDVPPPRREDGLSDLDRLTRAIQRQWGPVPVIYPLSVMRVAARTLRAEGGRVTVTLIREYPGNANTESGIRNSTLNADLSGTPQHPSDVPHSAFRIPSSLRVVRIEPGDTTTRHFGLAIDVGTTTVAVQLVNLTMASVLATRSDYNDQIECGLDVLARINYARRPDRLEELRARVVGTINRLIDQVCAGRGVDPREICNAVISGNTTMTHLLLGLPPEHIRLDPYTPTVLAAPFLPAAEIGLAINPDSWVYLSPCVGSYVGGDITAGLLCTDLATDTDEVNLFIDVGTNGELVVGSREFLMSCACSAGPAFEGGGIDCGMRAALGAIEKVDVDPETGVAAWQTIGRVRPKGICGSGMIDLLAKLFTTGWLDAAGKLDRARPSPAIVIDGRKAHYVIAPAGQSDIGKAIAISETDIENVIRAKAAIYSACALMLERIGLDFADLANIYIAGGFGRFLDLENAVTLGLLPDVDRARFHYVGNTSLMGSYMLAVSQEYRRLQVSLARRMTCIELSTEPSYMQQYTGALFLPHTDLDRFPSVKGGARRGGPSESRAAERPGMKASGANVPETRIPGLADGAHVSREQSNKEKALLEAANRAASRLVGVDLAHRCRVLGLPPPAPDGSVTVRVFGQDLRLAPPGFEAVGPTDTAVRPADRVLALRYLACDLPVEPTGRLISFRDLPGGQFYYEPFCARSVRPLVQRFGNDLDALRANLARFDHQPADIGDLAARIGAVGRVELTLVYRAGDEEFAPTAEVFFDECFRHVFDAEDATVIAGRICLGLL